MKPEDVSITEINGVPKLQMYDPITMEYADLPWDDTLAQQVRDLHERREQEHAEAMAAIQREFEESES